MNDIVQLSPALTPDAFLEKATEFEKTAPRVAETGVPLLRMLKQDGSWVYGKENTDVEDGSEWVIDPASLAQGFIAWHMSKIEGERMAVLGQDPIDPADLPPVSAKNGWESQVAFGLICLTGEDEGTAVMYKSNNRGGIEAWGNVFAAIKARAAAGKSYTPVVLLNATSYLHSEYGRIWKPVFDITRWYGDEDEAPQIEEQPKRRRRKTA